MIKIIKKREESNFTWRENECKYLGIKIIEQYIYDTEEEKLKHKEKMEFNGWIDSGQIKEIINGSEVWFGSYLYTVCTD